MNVVIDTSVWSLVLRRKRPSDEHVAEVRRLIGAKRVVVPGVIRQELLSGVRDAAGFASLRDYLRQFDDAVATAEDHETAAAFHNACRAAGVQSSGADFLIAALAYRLEARIYTTDRDFARFAAALPVTLHAPG